jgi:hypothetical protein
MPKGTVTCNNILGLYYNATAIANIADNASASPITAVGMALATASYSASSTLASNETAYTNYVRQAPARTTGGWTAPSSGATSNAAAIEYPQCGVTGATITSAATGKSVAGAADVFHYGDLNAPIAVSLQIQPRFPIGAVTITET